mgnify:CR=1 FL=1
MQGVRTFLDNRRRPLGGRLHRQDGAAADDLRVGVLQVGVVHLAAGSGRVSAQRARGAPWGAGACCSHTISAHGKREL